MGKTYNKDETKKKLISAVGEILLEDGFSELGINSIAKKAGVNKVLIYRYFDGLEGLYQKFAESIDPFNKISSELENIIKKNKPAFPEMAMFAFSSIMAVVDNNEILAEVMRWEISSTNSIIRIFEEKREESGMNIMRMIVSHYELPPSMDLAAIASLFTAGLIYLSIRSNRIDMYNGIPIREDEGKERLLSVIKKSIEGMMIASE
ncbi:MAG: TetR/AcrR family transcriptional regulator [Spirochaetaceae bacterium]|nr:TetR/AcrR family transcriptional regulator [Spirochaetaceae bacterium]